MTLTLRPLPLRLLLAALMLAGAILTGWKVVTTSLSEILLAYIERTPGIGTVERREAAGLAVRYAPDSPMARLQAGAAGLAAAAEGGEPELADLAVAEIRRALALSPSDYRIQLALGRALERAGRPDEARGAFEQARQLAPDYFDTHWALGNHLLRQGDREGSFAAMRQALALRPSAFPLVFDYASNAWAGDVEAIIAALDPPPPTLARMAVLLVRRQRPDDGIRAWRRLTSPQAEEARQMAAALVDTGHHGDAWRIWSAAGLAVTTGIASDALLANAGFEERIQVNSAVPFHYWRITSGNGVRVSLDRKDPHQGQQSLRVSFSLDGGQPLTVASQTIPAAPNQTYCLSFYARTEELKSLRTPLVEIFDADHPEKAYAATAPLSGETTDWTLQTLRIRTAPATEALTVRLQRPQCSDPQCSIEGRLWLDSLALGQCAAAKP